MLPFPFIYSLPSLFVLTTMLPFPSRYSFTFSIPPYHHAFLYPLVIPLPPPLLHTTVLPSTFLQPPSLPPHIPGVVLTNLQYSGCVRGSVVCIQPFAARLRALFRR